VPLPLAGTYPPTFHSKASASSLVAAKSHHPFALLSTRTGVTVRLALSSPRGRLCLPRTLILSAGMLYRRPWTFTRGCFESG
jgi:hypothetical protein